MARAWGGAQRRARATEVSVSLAPLCDKGFFPLASLKTYVVGGRPHLATSPLDPVHGLDGEHGELARRVDVDV